MPGYRRFVAYVYEYRKGKKGGNCGFLKVEARGERCRIEVHLQCPGLTPYVTCRIYGFVRNAGLMDGFLLGSCETRENAAECTVETSVGDMGGSGVSLEKMGGMILLTENGAFFGTEWDDQPIRPENFREVTAKKGPEKKEREIKLPETPVQEPEKKESASEEPEKEESASEEPEKKESASQEPEKEESASQEPEQREECAGEPEGTEEKQEISQQPEEEAGPQISEEQPQIQEKISALEQESGAEAEEAGEPPRDVSMQELPPCEEKVSEKDPPGRMPLQDMCRSEADLREKAKSETVQYQGMRRSGTAAPETGTGSVPSPKKRRRPDFGEACSPFMDGEIVDCRKIQPADFVHLGRRDCALRNNRFLSYGYYNFGHLLVGRKTNGQYILGVPGGYDQQERFMANMFGFPYFKESREIELPKGRGGYWYRLINAPDLH